MNEHTPGPWEWWTSNSWKRLRHSDRGVSTNVIMPVVCPDGHPDLEVTAADMALIAAAPDMLAALQQIHAADVASLAELEKMGLGHARSPENFRLVELARVAIAKATGQGSGA
jgi:hypothetical protein